MIAQKASSSIEQAVCYELQNIVKEYGATYASSHEAYAVLKEEIEEAADSQKEMESRLAVIINTEDPPEVRKQLNPDAEDINSK